MAAEFIVNFEDRVKEVEKYFKFLEKLDVADIKILNTENGVKTSVDSDIFIILKANAFLIIYNLIEYSIMDAIDAVYQAIEDEPCSYDSIIIELRNLWTKAEFKKAFDVNSSWNTYHNKTTDLIDSVIRRSVIRLKSRSLPDRGNIDADKIRRICDMHKFNAKSHYRARGGAALRTVVTQRNSLAHGSLSFVECGRQYEFHQLKQWKQESVIYVRSILKNIENYIDSKHYKI